MIKENIPKKRVKFHYMKSSNHRVVHCDGISSAFAGENLVLSLFSVRPLLPVLVEYEHTEDGTFGEVIENYTRNSYVREIEVTASLNINVAKEIYKLLGEQIAEEEKLRNKE